VKLLGFEDVDRALRELPKKMQKSAVRSGMRKIANDLRADMQSRVARSKVPPHIADGIEVRGIKQKSDQSVGLAIGPIRKFFYGWHIEKGTSKTGAQPWARPAFEGWSKGALKELRVVLWKRVQSAARRLAKRRALA
jgi:hypothetical protein